MVREFKVKKKSIIDKRYSRWSKRDCLGQNKKYPESQPGN